MKTPLMIGDRTACLDNLPRRALLALDPACVNCKRFRRTRLFKQAAAALPGPRKNRGEVQPDLFPG